ncbi:MAG TPA: TadE family protein [Candidatus Acidoferrales bacterium]|nr:TadE family protein [Candidatus Acidoferrales bacterium]
MTINKDGQRGQTVVEFSLVALFFFILLFAIIEFAHLFYVRLTVRHAIGDAGRFMVTGRTLTDGSGNPIPREEAIERTFEKWLIGTGAGLQGFVLTCQDGSPCSGGTAEETVTLTATFHKPLFIAYFGNFFGGSNGCPKGHLCFSMSTTWRNEPFEASGG